jgi:NAD(P)-dependent dehydrogenase (short-subunit alcohol dehydrogenase family)
MDPRPDYGYDTYRGSGKLNGKVALITGADSGIGRAVAVAYAREGADVAISYLNEDKDAQETQRVVEEAGRQTVLLPGDLVTEAGCKAAVQGCVDKFGRIDILVNNASVQGAMIKDIREISRERLERTFMTNIVGMITIIQAAMDHMKPGSSIINTSSVNAYTPMPDVRPLLTSLHTGPHVAFGQHAQILDYSVTKGAIVTLTKALAQKLLGENGIRVNSVAPGPVWTPLIPASFPGKMVTTFGADMTPIKRAAQPRELAPAYVYLASDEASYTSGTTLGVAGGMPLN